MKEAMVRGGVSEGINLKQGLSAQPWLTCLPFSSTYRINDKDDKDDGPSDCPSERNNARSGQAATKALQGMGDGFLL